MRGNSGYVPDTIHSHISGWFSFFSVEFCSFLVFLFFIVENQIIANRHNQSQIKLLLMYFRKWCHSEFLVKEGERQWLFLFFFSFLPLFYFRFFWALSLLLQVGFLLLGQAGCMMWYTGFSLWWFLLLQSTGWECIGFNSCGSVIVAHRLLSIDLGLGSCGTWA